MPTNDEMRDRFYGHFGLQSARSQKRWGRIAWWPVAGVAVAAAVLSVSNLHQNARLPDGSAPASTSVRANLKMATTLRHGTPLVFKVGPFRVIAFRSLAGPHPNEILRAWYPGNPGPGMELSVAWGQYGFFSGPVSFTQLSGGDRSSFSLPLNTLPQPSVPVQAKWTQHPQGHQHVATVSLGQARVLQATHHLRLTSITTQGWSASYQRETFTGHGINQPYGELTVTRKSGTMPRSLHYELVLAPGLENTKMGGFAQNTKSSAWANQNLAWTGMPQNPHLILSWDGHRISLPLHPTH
ncbi:MAG: hypothetical protein C7B43_19235 [Sulfobacillus benefaciens]|jgi:hypothetical protein|uniref:Uncharacterized protein n=1 Tax=Sulfobacillus benefaciens TaxID=453960 RepID=A0A2T2WQ66_9FIRM|nr:MAG: hypothetical protein C7B43_19235 [Sulfobacillus benefaciens]